MKLIAKKKLHAKRDLCERLSKAPPGADGLAMWLTSKLCGGEIP